MSDNRNSRTAGKTRQQRIIKLAPMTRAVRSALTASALTLAIGFGGNVAAAGHPATTAHTLQTQRAAIDIAPVFDLTVVAGGVAGMHAPLMALAINEYSAGDIIIDNADPITEAQPGNAAAISAYSMGGYVGITNQAGASLDVSSTGGSAIGIYGYSAGGNVVINNAADIQAYAAAGLADGIFASGANVDVSNSGAISADGLNWAAGIEAQAGDVLTVGNSGDITVSTYAMQAHAYGIYATGTDVTVVNSGAIAVQGYYATGIEARSYGDIHIDNSGNITAGTPTDSAVATGINATSGGEGAVVAVTNSGNIDANAYYGGTGISAVSSGMGGSASVTNSGAIYAGQGTKYGVGAYGISTSADGDSTINNSGAITVVSAGAATGESALSFAGTASITNSGDVTVTSTAALGDIATGLLAFSANGDAAVSNSGNVTATGKYIGTAVDASGFGSVTVNNSGSLYANGDKYAYGVRAISGAGDVVVSNSTDGSIGFYSYLGRGFGVLAIASLGDVAVDNAGTIAGYAYGQAVGVFGLAEQGNTHVDNSGSITIKSNASAAVGVFARADYGVASVTNSGSIDTYSKQGVAYGVLARSDYGVASVINSGMIKADGYLAATGIAAVGSYGASVTTTGGSIDVFATGQATGINASAFSGDAVVENAGDIQVIGLALGADAISASSVYGNAAVINSGALRALSLNGNVNGVIAKSGAGNVVIENHGDVLAYSSAGNAIGLYGYSQSGDVGIANTGTLYAASYYGLADAIFASGMNVSVHNDGALEAIGDTWAAGIEAQGTNAVTVSNTATINANASVFGQVFDSNGAVVAAADGGKAFGIYATAGEGGAVVVNSGNLMVNGGYATGIYVQSAGDIGISNSGDIVVGSGLKNKDLGYGYTLYYGTQIATGISANTSTEGAVVQIGNSGDITAAGTFGAYGISAVSSGIGGTVTVVNSGQILASQANKYGAGVYGVFASGDGDTSVGNSGTITVDSAGMATGVAALSFAGDALVVNAGDITATSSANGYYGASGIVAFAGNGAAAVSNTGNVTATSSAFIGASAHGVDVQGQQGATVYNSGSIYANGKYSAYAVSAISAAGDVGVNNTAAGQIGFYSFGGNGFGILGVAYTGDVAVVNAGTIEGYAFGQSSGVFAHASVGNAGVSNTGHITVVSGNNPAVGIFARANNGTATVVNSGDISSTSGSALYSGTDAYGIMARGGYTQVGNSGNIQANGYLSATGIAARSTYGTTVSTSASSKINASALLVSIGIEGRSSQGNVLISNAGDINATGVLGGGVGIQAYSTAGNTNAINTGHIKAVSDYGMAIGVTSYAAAGGNAVASNGGTIFASGGDYGAYGMSVQSGAGNATANNSGDILATSTGTSIGVVSEAHGNIVVNNSATGTIEAGNGALAAGVQVNSTAGTSTVNNAGMIHASGGTLSAGVVFKGSAGANVLNNYATGMVRADGADGAAFAVMGGDGSETINNSGKVQGAVALYGGDDVFNNKAGGVWDLLGTTHSDFGDGNDTITNAVGGKIVVGSGKIEMGAGDDSLINAGILSIGSGGVVSFGDGNDLLNNGGLVSLIGGSIKMGAGTNSFINGGTLQTIGSGNLVDVGAAGTFTSGGTLNFLNGLTTDKLQVTGTMAGAGNINLDLNLVNNTVDQLAVTGSMAASAAQKVNVAFTGMPLTAHASSVFATVTGTSVAGNFVAGQMIGYNYAANFLDVGLTVSSQLDTSNATPDKFSVNIDVNGLNDTGALAASAASGAAGVMNSQMGTFRQRLGVNPYGDAGKVLSAFIRGYTDQGDMRPGHLAGNFGQGGHFNYSQASWGREFGINANLFENFHAGLVLGNADSRQRLTDGGMGESRLNGATIGGYATWYVPGSFYVDFNVRQMGADIRSMSAAGVMTSRAHTNAMSLEAGYEWNVGSFNLVPQVQYTRTKVEDVKTFFGDRVNFDSHGGTFTRARLGLEMNKTFQMGDVRWTPYGSLNAVRDVNGKSTYTVGNFYGNTNTRGTSAMAELGLGVQKGGLGFNIGANWVDGGAYKSFVGGQASVRFAW